MPVGRILEAVIGLKRAGKVQILGKEDGFELPLEEVASGGILGDFNVSKLFCKQTRFLELLFLIVFMRHERHTRAAKNQPTRDLARECSSVETLGLLLRLGKIEVGYYS